MAKEEITTIEDLAALIQRTRASQEDIRELRDEMNARFAQVDAHFDHLDARVGRIDEIPLHARRWIRPR